MICSCWKNTLGADLYQAYTNKLSDPTTKAINAIKNLVNELDVPVRDELFENSDLAEIISVLQELPEWSSMEAQLANMEMDEEEVTEVNF